MLSEPKGLGQKYEKVRMEQGEGEREKEYIREQNLLNINRQWQQRSEYFQENGWNYETEV